MTAIILNQKEYQAPTSKESFKSLIEQITPAHGELREKSLLFYLSSKNDSEISYTASMVGEGKYGTLHLLFELLGQPKYADVGFITKKLSSAQIQTMVSAFTPFLDERSSHPNVNLLLSALENKAEVTCTILNISAGNEKNKDSYLQFRTTTLFNLFNEGALRGCDAPARQALLDSFGTLPNRYLTESGEFLISKEEDPFFLRQVEGFSVLENNNANFSSAGGIDKFPSLISQRGARLLADGNRIVPSVMIRDGVHVGKRNIFMFHAAVNIAAYIGDDNMIDSHASIASSVQIGNKNKIGSFVSLEGVLSPANAAPVFIGNENFLGSFARIGTGLVVGDNNFISAGVNISLGTKIKDCRNDSPTKGQYVCARDFNGQFNNLALTPNNAVRNFNDVDLLPGEYIVFENTPEFMSRFEGDSRIKGSK